MTKTAFAGTRWSTLEERRERAFSATYYLDDQQPDGAPSARSHALYLEVEQYLREVDNLLAPTRGWMASAADGRRRSRRFDARIRSRHRPLRRMDSARSG